MRGSRVTFLVASCVGGHGMEERLLASRVRNIIRMEKSDEDLDDDDDDELDEDEDFDEDDDDFDDDDEEEDDEE
jgi:hypothetical protein